MIETVGRTRRNLSVAENYNAWGLPNVLVLDKSGIVRYNGHSIETAEKEVKVWLN